ncbi:aldo/keto reductase [Clostridia bacterium]|nr:aldo/keto reductase [Clostridia bacterium]
MKLIEHEDLSFLSSQIVLGCMRISSMETKQIQEWFDTALSCGINLFDHADIYGGGECENLFAKALSLSPAQRETILIQSKCGICEGYFDFSKEHILNSVDGILKRLQTDYLDVLLLHRPDTLMEPEEVAEAFDELFEQGKVRSFGVSNQNPMQIELLKQYVEQPLWCNQLQFSLAHSVMVDSGLTVNMQWDQGINREGSILEYSRLNDMTIQAWSPFQKGYFEGVFLGDQKDYARLNEVISEMEKKYSLTPEGIAISWITSHPAQMQVVLGTTNNERIKNSCTGANVKLERKDWYALYKATGKRLP